MLGTTVKQLLFQQKICKSEIDRAAGKPDTLCDWASNCVKGTEVDEELSYSPSVLSLVFIMFLFPVFSVDSSITVV